MKPHPQPKAQEKILKTHDNGASRLFDQEVILTKIRHFSQLDDIKVMSSTSPVDLYKGGLFDLGKVRYSFWSCYSLTFHPCVLSTSDLSFCRLA